MKALLPLAILVAVVLSALAPTGAANAQQLPPLPLQFNPDNLGNIGRPGGRRRGGGSRGGCPADGDLTALAYADSKTAIAQGVSIATETVGNLTTLAQPTLWFYLPMPLSNDTPASLVVKGSQGNLLYQGQLSGETDRAGIVRVPMAVDLAVGDSYEWFVTLTCDAETETTVNGWVGRRAASPTLSRMVARANSRNRAALYAHDGFLQDTLSELAALRLANPDNAALTQDWIDLLSELGLAEVANAPLLECCQLADASPETTESEVIEETTEGVESAEDAELSEPTQSDPQEAIETEPSNAPDNRTILQRARDRG